MPHERFGHLRNEPGGPEWTLGQLRQAIPPATVALQYDPKVKITNPESALLKAFELLESKDKADHEAAFRITGQTVKQTGDPKAIRLLSYLFYHGIGGRRDEANAVRATLPLIRAGESDVCDFAAACLPATLKSVAVPMTPDKISRLKPRQPIRVSGIVTACENEILQIQGYEQNFTLSRPVEGLSLGRYVNFWGLLTENGFRALIGEVPKPSASFQWKVNSAHLRARTWQVHSVSVTVKNDGVQPIKMVNFRVRCFSNVGYVNDQTRQAEVLEIAPGKSKTIDVGFEMYNYEYIDAVSSPKAEVSVNEVEW